jgi:hypothetical protein
MNKFFCLILSILFALILLLSTTGCKKVELTKDNIKDYISFSITITDCVVTSSKKYCNVNVITSKKQNCTFENVEIQIVVSSPVYSSWHKERHGNNPKLQLDYNGNAQTTESFYSSSSSYFLSSDRISINIISVSGYVSK